MRTNYYQRTREGETKPYLSFKFDPSEILVLPQPRPRFEIFVYSPRAEGVHLRGGEVARGGIRWSDRREDFRTEILGLMKAQMVKNAVIVPVGAKGGFVVKRPPAEGGREALMQEVVFCYKTLVRGMLDLTDNRVGGGVEPPPDVVRYDEDDPYLVVAADKGTATFSDIANGISAEYGFWLGDAFASGGSAGLRPQGDGDNGEGRVGVGEAPLPRARRRRAERGLHGRRHRGHVRRRLRQRHAPQPRTSGSSARSTTSTSSSTRTPTPRRASRSASGSSGCRARRGRSTTSP